MHQYININGGYGLAHNGIAEYTSAQALMDQMDRLGIWQTVLEVDPGTTNALYRNRKLLRDMVKLPNWKERIIPAFSADMCTLVQRDGMRQLVETLQTHRPNCLALYPKNNSYRLRTIDAVLDQISFLDQVVLINYDQLSHCATSADDLLYLAKRYPNMRFVVRKGRSPAWQFLFDTVRRADNIYMDMSRVHTADGIDLACEFLGEDKILFGSGRRVDGGASMGALVYADVSEKTKDKIRWGNFISLFTDPADREHLTKNLKTIENKVANSFWTPFMEGKGMGDVEVLDSHAHLGYTASDGLVYNLTFEDEIKGIERDMERFNIQKIHCAVTGIPDPYECHWEVEEAVRGKEDHIKGYVRYNPNFESVFTDEFLAERFATGHYVGLKCLPGYMGVDIRDRRFERMFRYAHEHNLAILIHTWDNSPCLGSAGRCAEAAAKWPNAKVIFGHTGGGQSGREECEAIAQDPKYNNVWFEFCGSFEANHTWKETLEFIDYRRVLFGTDAPIHSTVWELARLLSEDIPDEQMRAILGGNAKRLFGY